MEAFLSLEETVVAVAGSSFLSLLHADNAMELIKNRKIFLIQVVFKILKNGLVFIMGIRNIHKVAEREQM
jgi:hypothetical protein